MNPILTVVQIALPAVLPILAVIFGCGVFGDEGASISFDTSADGRQIVLSSDSGDLFLFELDSKKVTRITETSEIEKSPSLSPDGKTVVYSATAPEDSSAFRIFKFDVGTKKVTQLTKAAGVSDSSPRFSGDGRKIYFFREFRSTERPLGVRWTDADLCVMDADGTNRKRLTHEKYSGAWYPVESPDGSSIMFQAVEYKRAEADDEEDDELFDSVYSLDLDGSGSSRNFGDVDWDDKVELSEITSASKSDDSQRRSEDDDEPGKAGTEPDKSGTDQPTRFQVVGGMIVDLKEERAGWISLKDHSISNPRPIPNKRLLFLNGIGDPASSGYHEELWMVDLNGKNPRKIAGRKLFQDPMNYQPGN